MFYEHIKVMQKQQVQVDSHTIRTSPITHAIRREFLPLLGVRLKPIQYELASVIVDFTRSDTPKMKLATLGSDW